MTIENFEYKTFVKLEPWMKRGSDVETIHGKGKITYVMKNQDECLNINVRVWMNKFQYQDYRCAAWAVKHIN